MINKYKLEQLSVIDAPYMLSEKALQLSEKNNTIVFKTSLKHNKQHIKKTIQDMFHVKIKKINTIIVKEFIRKKIKNSTIKKKHYRVKKWKKIYAVLSKKSELEAFKYLNKN